MSFDPTPYLQRAARGDEAALAVLYAQYSAPVYSLALRVLRNPLLAQEVTQDVFLKVWKNPGAWDARKGQFSSWLLTLTRYTAIDHLRRELNRAGKNTDLGEHIAAADDGPEAPPLDQLQYLLAQLPQEQRQVVELAYFAGLKHSEMAERLGLPLGTVKTRLRLGLRKLRALLTDGDSDDDTDGAVDDAPS